MQESEFQSTVAAATRGDRRALSVLYARYHRMLVRYLRPQIPGYGEQMAHETWLAVAEGLKGFSAEERSFRMLLLAHADELVDAHRRSSGRPAPAPQRHRVIDLRSSPVGDQPVADAAIAELLHGLSPHQARVLLLRVVGGLTAEETAELLRDKPTTVRLTEYEALQQMARRLQRAEAEQQHAV